VTVDHGRAADLLAAFGRAWETFDGDAWSDLFDEDAEYHEDPFDPPLTGRNAIRAYLLEAAGAQRQVEFTVERHWVSGRTVLAAWHASWVRTADGARIRIAGFMTLELGPDERIVRFREWWHRRETPVAGQG
jgi:ketosteroid isomerase-like protein